MPQQTPIAVADLLLDEKNARLKHGSDSQQQVTYNLAKKQGRRLLKLAQSIAENRLDPAQLLSVIATRDGKYVVKEGNRRTLALKALETPSLVEGALSAADFRKLQELSRRYVDDPIETVECVVYAPGETEDVNGWVFRRHTGAQEGAGLVEWDSDEKDRFSARFGAAVQRSLGGQALDLLESVDGPLQGDAKIATTLTRILTTPAVRDRIGLERRSGQLVSRYPKDEIVKGLRHIVGDLTNPDPKQRLLVTHVYHAHEREAYAQKLPDAITPRPETALETAVPLTELPDSAPSATTTTKPARTTSAKGKRSRVNVAAAGLNVPAGRCADIYRELRTLSADEYANAGAVLLRVFLELSIDQYAAAHQVMSEQERRNWPLARRMKEVADHLAAADKIDGQLKRAVHKVADSEHTLAASVIAFNQYVHNHYVYPKPSELRTSWDELHPFLLAVWE